MYTTTTVAQHKTLNVILKAIGNGRKVYEHDGENVSISVSNEDHRYLRETSETLDIDELMKRSDILDNALKRIGVDTEVYSVDALVREVSK